jgi:hypothetical protein
MRRTWKVAMRYLATAAALLAFTPAQADPAVPYLPPATAIPQQPAHPKPSLYAEWLKLLVPPAQYDKPYPGRLIENRAIDMESAGMRSAIATAGRRATPPSEGARRGYSKWHGRERTGSRDA